MVSGASARIWNGRLNQHLKSLSFYSKAPAIHASILSNTSGVIYCSLGGRSHHSWKGLSNSIDKVKERLQAEFEMKDLGNCSTSLGSKFIGIASKRQLHINQSGYINSILERFGMEDSKPAPTPIATGTTLHKATDGDALVDQAISKSSGQPDVCNALHSP